MEPGIIVGRDDDEPDWVLRHDLWRLYSVINRTGQTVHDVRLSLSGPVTAGETPAGDWRWTADEVLPLDGHSEVFRTAGSTGEPAVVVEWTDSSGRRRRTDLTIPRDVWPNRTTSVVSRSARRGI